MSVPPVFYPTVISIARFFRAIFDRVGSNRIAELIMAGFSRGDRIDSQAFGPKLADRGEKVVNLIRKKKPAEDSVSRREGGNGLRPIFLRVGAIAKSVGSAYMEAGRSKIMCAVYGPRPDTRASHFVDVGRIYCQVRFAPFCGLDVAIAERLEKELPLLVRPALETAVLLNRFPKSVIEIYLLVLELEGDVSSLAITCSSMALADAGIEMYDLVAACSVVKRSSGDVVVDPSRADLEGHTGYVLTSLMPSRGEITQYSQHGTWDVDALQKGTDLSLEGARQIHTLMRQVLTHPTSSTEPKAL